MRYLNPLKPFFSLKVKRQYQRTFRTGMMTWNNLMRYPKLLKQALKMRTRKKTRGKLSHIERKRHFIWTKSVNHWIFREVMVTKVQEKCHGTRTRNWIWNKMMSYPKRLKPVLSPRADKKIQPIQYHIERKIN
uniref:Uncharacterized protein n=1 Tax=Cacopsylla melanoneura TaxID=428564 RepID=A0A8D9FDM0_9HEMI